MNATAPALAQHTWQSLAQRLRWRFNLGWIFEVASMPLMLFSAGLFASLLFLRMQQLLPAWPLQVAAAVSGCLLILACATWWARRHFLTPEQAWVKLEKDLHLHNALTMAHLGLRDWPPAPEKSLSPRYRWQLHRLGLPWIVLGLSWITALSLPLIPETVQAKSQSQPQAWSQMEEWLTKLEEEKILEPESRTEHQKAIDELRAQSPESWFSHESLHATDTLKEQLQHDIQQAAQQMQQAQQSLSGFAADQGPTKLDEATRDQLMQQFSEAQQGLQSNPLNLNQELKDALSQVDPQQLKKLSPEQLNQLKEKLKNPSQNLQELAEGFQRPGGSKGNSDPSPNKDPGAGQGAPDRGPGTAPVNLSDERNDFGTDKRESLTNEDLSRMELGDTEALADSRPEVEKDFRGPQSSAASRSTGAGGTHVWQDTLTPEEKTLLKSVFD
jgi:hypothetical protein